LTWYSFFPRLDVTLANIRQFVRDGLDADAKGMLLTDWGDYGHYQPLSLPWYPYLFGAATGWSGAQTKPGNIRYRVRREVSRRPLSRSRGSRRETPGPSRRRPNYWLGKWVVHRTGILR